MIALKLIITVEETEQGMKIQREREHNETGSPIVNAMAELLDEQIDKTIIAAHKATQETLNQYGIDHNSKIIEVN